jgi:hypothetical protein
MLYGIHKNKDNIVFLKVDFEEAYEKISCNFLKRVMIEKKNFLVYL